MKVKKKKKRRQAEALKFKKYASINWTVWNLSKSSQLKLSLISLTC